MSDTFRLQGTYTTTPLVGVPSGFPSLASPIAETTQLTNKTLDFYTLATESVVPVDFGGVTNAHVVIIKVVGGSVRVRLTSASGATQAVPVDSFATIISSTVPFTAIDLLRTPGVETIVQVFLGEIE